MPEVAVPQSESCTQPQVLTVPQSELEPAVQRVVLVELHCWQEPALGPVVSQAGRVGSVHPPVGPSPVQLPHLCVVGPHAGALAGQSRSLRQPMQLPVGTSQIAPVAAVQAVRFVSEHCWQLP
jgi:hypothetical protein